MARPKNFPLIGKTSKKPIIGLTGGIGSGKSTVAEAMRSLGAAVIDADAQVHEELKNPRVVDCLREWWGNEVVASDGTSNRQVIARIVFDNPAELKRLENLLYPRLAVRREALLKEFMADPNVSAVVLDAPKLYEAGLNEACDVVVFVEADRATRLARVASDRGWSETELDKRENLQIPLDTKKASADYVVHNHSSRDDLLSEVEPIFSSILASYSG